MANSADDFAQMSDDQMAAAGRAASQEERIAHLEIALRYAQIAAIKRKRETNVFILKSRLEQGR